MELTTTARLVRGALILAATGVSVWAIHALLFRLLRHRARRSASAVDDTIVRHTRRPSLVVSLFVALFALVGNLPFPVDWVPRLQHAFGLGIIASAAWLILGFLNVFRELTLFRYKTDVSDNLTQRRVLTQVQLFHRLGAGLVIMAAVAVMLMTFEEIQRLGVSLLASAGVLGLVLGWAAQPVISNVLAGAQIAITQPIRLDDVVVVGGQWGRVEEIGSTYVVIRTWDWRSLILPISHFIDEPFENWTRDKAEIIGTVYLHVDYSVPVQTVRDELLRILQASGMWDRQIWTLQVVDATERTVKLRATMSAEDAPTAWELRCHVREKLIAFLQARYPGALPRSRVELESDERYPDRDRPVQIA